MAKALQITVKENKAELTSLMLKQNSNSTRKKIDLLLVLLKYPDGLNKTDLSHKVGISHNTANKWRKQYETGGIAALLADNRKGGNRHSVISIPVRNALDKRVNNAKGAPKSYAELQRWIALKFGTELSYNTLRNYLIRKHKTKPKVARKSHIQKDDNAAALFKKTRSGA
jgi:transposase